MEHETLKRIKAHVTFSTAPINDLACKMRYLTLLEKIPEIDQFIRTHFKPWSANKDHEDFQAGKMFYEGSFIPALLQPAHKQQELWTLAVAEAILQIMQAMSESNPMVPKLSARARRNQKGTGIEAGDVKMSARHEAYIHAVSWSSKPVECDVGSLEYKDRVYHRLMEYTAVVHDRGVLIRQGFMNTMIQVELLRRNIEGGEKGSIRAAELYLDYMAVYPQVMVAPDKLKTMEEDSGHQPWLFDSVF